MEGNRPIVHQSGTKACGWVVVLDLDDTLYPESDFVISGLKACARVLEERTGIPVAREMVQAFQLGRRDSFQLGLALTGEKEFTPLDLRAIYHGHPPELSLPESTVTAIDLLTRLTPVVAMITDGYSRTQRNKLAALGLNDRFYPLIISEEIGSEKPAPQNYTAIETVHPNSQYVYIGDNPTKDFVTPRARGWLTIQVCCHRKRLEEVPPEYQAHRMVDSLYDAVLFLHSEYLSPGAKFEGLHKTTGPV
jgi:putative hydrolase of the HAD superfamily